MEMYSPTIEESVEFAKESSYIEGEYSAEAVRDHLGAWEYMRGQHTLTLDNILECHRILQKELRPDIAGKQRDCNVYVGGRICPNPASAKYMLAEWIEKYAKAEVFANKPDVDGEIRISHVEFEKIHPFEDGNGRVGRIIMNWHRIRNNLPLLIIHEGDEQMEYYTWFKEEYGS